ncbi:MAG: ArsR family transcriptional regulator [Thermoplasmatota archaeon]
MTQTATASPAELQAALQTLGATRVEATLLAYLQSHGAAGTKDIVSATGLRQPEVSVGMRTFRDRGWVDAESVAGQGKGRPMHRYRLTVPPKEIRSHYQQIGEENVAMQKAAIQALKALG